MLKLVKALSMATQGAIKGHCWKNNLKGLKGKVCGS